MRRRLAIYAGIYALCCAGAHAQTLGHRGGSADPVADAGARPQTLAIIGATVWTNGADAPSLHAPGAAVPGIAARGGSAPAFDTPGLAPSDINTQGATTSGVGTPGVATPLRNVTLLVRDGRIVSMAAGAVPPVGVRVLDARGRVVTPLLDAAATQIGLVELGGASDTDDRTGSGVPLGAAFDVAFGVDANELTVQQARAAGVGHALVFPGPAAVGVFAGQAARLDLTATHSTTRADAGLVERAQVAQFVSADGAAARAEGGSRAAMWGQLRNALAEARSLHGQTAVFKPRDQLQNHADIDALLPVLERRMPLAITANREADIREALAVAEDFGVNVVIVGGAEGWRVATLLAARHVPVVLDPLDDLPMSYELLGARRDNAALLARAGVLIAFTVSAQGIYLSYNLGPALREGAGIAVANGLPYAQALRAITRNAALIWGDAGHRGVLAPGEWADFVLWDGDPLEPSSAPLAVLHHGQEISLRTRQQLLRERYRPVSIASTPQDSP